MKKSIPIKREKNKSDKGKYDQIPFSFLLQNKVSGAFKRKKKEKRNEKEIKSSSSVDTFFESKYLKNIFSDQVNKPLCFCG